MLNTYRPDITHVLVDNMNFNNSEFYVSVQVSIQQLH